jgi:hypothetical protein
VGPSKVEKMNLNKEIQMERGPAHAKTHAQINVARQGNQDVAVRAFAMQRGRGLNRLLESGNRTPENLFSTKRTARKFHFRNQEKCQNSFGFLPARLAAAQTRARKLSNFLLAPPS